MPIRLPKLLFTEIVSATIGKESGASSLLDTYIKSSPLERAKQLGTRIRIGSLLWKCSETITSDETQSLQEIKMYLNMEGLTASQQSSLSHMCITSLLNNSVGSVIGNSFIELSPVYGFPNCIDSFASSDPST